MPLSSLKLVSEKRKKKKPKTCQWLFSCQVVSNSLQPCELQPARLLSLQDFPGKNTGVGCHFLLQGIILTQKLSLCLLHWQADFLQLSHPENPVVKNVSCNAGDAVLIPGQGTKIPHATEQLSLLATTTEPMGSSQRVHVLQQTILSDPMKI